MYVTSILSISLLWYLKGDLSSHHSAPTAPSAYVHPNSSVRRNHQLSSKSSGSSWTHLSKDQRNPNYSSYHNLSPSRRGVMSA
ncbi:hypothetical protein G7K_3935-t1 [Saitoella complicata NRRL Y-17804]|uniref:Uncharacterized protein n=1 Tax=Saitoella complicata (strain BCRC 22490 / CBS 7301 / JCM 7358 / NBRC 10748 / NRRL Y-17804) TaxID=698492 RepID=A0A0E9NIX2_SAICN|nr:hypothetical protein G7K_3935-t1 [Saitoella complicata NRRL Y-17804]